MTNQQLPRLQSILHLDYHLRVLTGLHVGGSESGISIGGSDNPIIRDPLSKRPYVPGSSLKGKVRSLIERRFGKRQSWRIGQIYIHTCEAPADYGACEVCPLFGIPAPQQRWFCLTRLRFPDVFLLQTSAAALEEGDLDFPYAELKTEVAIDRTTSAAVPRNIERVPAGAVFGPGRISLFVYENDPPSYFDTLREGLALLEADYLGGSGARGSGRVRFEEMSCSVTAFPQDAEWTVRDLGRTLADLAALDQASAEVKALLRG